MEFKIVERYYPATLTKAVTHCTKNLIFFLQMLWKDGLFNKIALEYDLSCIIRKDDISFPRKYGLIL